MWPQFSWLIVDILAPFTRRCMPWLVLVVFVSSFSSPFFKFSFCVLEITKSCWEHVLLSANSRTTWTFIYGKDLGCRKDNLHMYCWCIYPIRVHLPCYNRFTISFSTSYFSLSFCHNQPTPHHQGRSRRSAYAPTDDGHEGRAHWHCQLIL